MAPDVIGEAVIIVLCCFSMSIFKLAIATDSRCHEEIKSLNNMVDSLRWKLRELVDVQHKVNGLERQMQLKEDRLKTFGRRLVLAEKGIQVAKQEKKPRSEKMQQDESTSNRLEETMLNINDKLSAFDLRLQAVEQDLKNISQQPEEHVIKPWEVYSDKVLQKMELNILRNFTRSLELENLSELRNDLDNTTRVLWDLKADYEENEAVRKHTQRLKENFMEHIKQTGTPMKLEDLLPTALNSDDEEDDFARIQSYNSDIENEDDSNDGDDLPQELRNNW